MVLSRKLARFNKVATNRALGLITPRLPGFGTVVHRGRRSGSVYRTPVNLFRVPDGFVVALTYGPGADWVKNVVAAGGCEIVTRGRHVKLVDPLVVHDETRKPVPVLVRRVLGAVGVADFLHLRRP